MKTINNYRVKEKKVLLRVDLNVPVVNGRITEKSRIYALKSTVKKLIENKNKIFLLSHFGRPNGQYNTKYSLEFICSTLIEELGIKKIHFINKFDNNEIKSIINKMDFGDVCLFENIRFHPGEEKNDLAFIKELSINFEIYINNAFSASHREHASIVGITQYLPSLAGDSLLEEIKNINLFINNPKKPNVAIIGGSKISTKINLLHNLIKFFDTIVIGGAMANTFLYANEINIGLSLVEKDLAKIAKLILEKAKNYNCKIILPIDVVCSNSMNDKSNIRHCDVQNILSDQMALDLGNKTIQLITQSILRTKMILWNGPLGAFEYKPFEFATIEIANVIKNRAKILNIITLVAGGDTISAIKMAKAEKSFSYISTAGGALLEWLEGKESPGFRALIENTID